MSKAYISVIVPIYNVETYVSKCIESICAQTLREIEILLIDDGSTDKSGEICDFYAQKDSRIKVLHQKNQGLLATRFIGTKEANADYVSFVDGDDYISPDHLESMWRMVLKEDFDMVSSFYLLHYNAKKIVTPPSSTFSGQYGPEVMEDCICSYIESLSSHSSSFIHVWHKLFKRTVLLEAFALIDTTVSNSEDILLSLATLSLTKKMYCLSEQFTYHYQLHLDSMSRAYTPDLPANYKRFLNSYMNLPLTEKADKVRTDLYPSFCYRRLFNLIYNECLGSPLTILKSGKKLTTILHNDPFWSCHLNEHINQNKSGKKTILFSFLVKNRPVLFTVFLIPYAVKRRLLRIKKFYL